MERPSVNGWYLVHVKCNGTRRFVYVENGSVYITGQEGPDDLDSWIDPKVFVWFYMDITKINILCW